MLDSTKNVNEVRNDFALQQSAIATLSQHALVGVDLQSLFDEATSLVHRTLRVAYATVMECGRIASF